MPAFSVYQLLRTSASLGILLCTVLDTGELLFPHLQSDCDCYMCSLPSACAGGREAHRPWQCVCVGSSYRQLMDCEIIQGKKKRLLEQTALRSQPCSHLSQLNVVANKI